jgi:hypothetical protein
MKGMAFRILWRRCGYFSGIDQKRQASEAGVWSTPMMDISGGKINLERKIYKSNLT